MREAEKYRDLIVSHEKPVRRVRHGLTKRDWSKAAYLLAIFFAILLVYLVAMKALR